MSYKTANMAWSKANGVKIALEDVQRKTKRFNKNILDYEVELHNKYARGIAVFLMFLICLTICIII